MSVGSFEMIAFKIKKHKYKKSGGKNRRIFRKEFS
jgi:hypothetical protein